MQNAGHPTHYEHVFFSQQVYEKDGGELMGGWHTKISSDKYNLSQEGYFGCAYIKFNTRQIIVAHRGTNGSHNFWSDLKIFFQNSPSAHQHAKLFVDKITLRHPAYTISQTGHSLGAIHAELCALEFKHPAVTFESPGTKKIIENHWNTKITIPFQNIINYLGDKNDCNSVGDHIGRILYVDVLSSDKREKHEEDERRHHALVSDAGENLACGEASKYVLLGVLACVVGNHTTNIKNFHSIELFLPHFNAETGECPISKPRQEFQWKNQAQSSVVIVDIT